MSIDKVFYVTQECRIVPKTVKGSVGGLHRNLSFQERIYAVANHRLVLFQTTYLDSLC